HAAEEGEGGRPVHAGRPPAGQEGLGQGVPGRGEGVRRGHGEGEGLRPVRAAAGQRGPDEVRLPREVAERQGPRGALRGAAPEETGRPAAEGTGRRAEVRVLRRAGAEGGAEVARPRPPLSPPRWSAYNGGRTLPSLVIYPRGLRCGAVSVSCCCVP